MRHLVAAVVIVMSGAGAVGCGDSVEEPARPQSSTVSSSPPPSSAPKRAVDRRAAKALLPKPAVPPGWIVLAEDGESNDTDASKLDRCEAQRMKRTATAFAETEFSHEDEGSVGEVIYLLAHAVQARRAARSLTDASARKCYVREMTARLQDAGALVGRASTSTVKSQRVGTDTSSFRATVFYAKDGLDAELTVDAVVFRVDRAVASLYFARVGSAFDETLRTDLSREAYRVMNQALRHRPR